MPDGNQPSGVLLGIGLSYHDGKKKLREKEGVFSRIP